ncbi:transposase [Streptomyces sp. R39]|uniref:Transposase n=1 Tax=Streptomyces sp. R39 TaxID=3238631 RepID=A0AB39QC08_9ACTN
MPNWPAAAPGKSPWWAACPAPAGRDNSSWPTGSSSGCRCSGSSPLPEPTCCGGCRPTGSCPLTGSCGTDPGSLASTLTPILHTPTRSRCGCWAYRLNGTGRVGEDYRLVTSLLDARRCPARQLAALYQERWEAEAVFAELKTRQRGARVVISSKTPDGVLQQIWAHLLVHHALRELMVRTAATRGLDPDQVSFTETLRSARPSVTVTPGSFSPDLLVRALVLLQHDLLERLLPHRRLRSQPRVVKRKMSNYRLKRTEHHTWPQPTRAGTRAVRIK